MERLCVEMMRVWCAKEWSQWPWPVWGVSLWCNGRWRYVGAAAEPAEESLHVTVTRRASRALTPALHARHTCRAGRTSAGRRDVCQLDGSLSDDDCMRAALDRMSVSGSARDCPLRWPARGPANRTRYAVCFAVDLVAEHGCGMGEHHHECRVLQACLSLSLLPSP